MNGLLDSIFSDANIEKLNKKKGREYLTYLNEILLQIDSETDFQKFLAIKARLNKSLENKEDERSSH